MAAAVAAFVLALFASACSAGQDPDDCGQDKCDGAGDFMSQLEGREDVIAQLLRQSEVDAEGVMHADYTTFLYGVSNLQGCSDETVKTFTVSDDLISGADPFPRLISVACSDQDSKASEFFIAASFEDAETGDVDLRDVEMFAWDAQARRYRFYAFAPAGDSDSVEVEIEPKRCQGCHLTPSDTGALGMRMTPIMNELTRPWTHLERPAWLSIVRLRAA